MANKITKALTYKGAAMTWECDSNRHMNVMYYINKFELAGRSFNLEMGTADMVADNLNMGIVVLEQQIRYLKEVFEDDWLHIESSLMDIGNKAFTVFHEMYRTRTKEKVSTMKAVVVLFDKVNRKALPFPNDLKKELLPFINHPEDSNQAPFIPNKRLIEVAKELNISIGIAVNFLNIRGFGITSNPNTKLSQEMYHVLIDKFKNKDQTNSQRIPRLIKVAKELNVGTSVLVNFLKRKGFDIIDKPTAKLSAEMYQALLKEFGEV